jgi:protein involved in temperature-dependent protein secretion
MARRTEWREDENGAGAFGLGQRMLATDAGEFPLLEAHAIALHHADAPAAADDVS